MQLFHTRTSVDFESGVMIARTDHRVTLHTIYIRAAFIVRVFARFLLQLKQREQKMRN